MATVTKTMHVTQLRVTGAVDEDGHIEPPDLWETHLDGRGRSVASPDTQSSTHLAS